MGNPASMVATKLPIQHPCCIEDGFGLSLHIVCTSFIILSLL